VSLPWDTGGSGAPAYPFFFFCTVYVFFCLIFVFKKQRTTTRQTAGGNNKKQTNKQTANPMTANPMLCTVFILYLYFPDAARPAELCWRPASVARPAAAHWAAP
jgi:hypothetical protein